MESKKRRGAEAIIQDRNRTVRKHFSHKMDNEFEFDKSKTVMTFDYVFGAGVSKSIEFSQISFLHSRKTGRIRQLRDAVTGKILFTYRPNGTIAPTVKGASMLLSQPRNQRARWIVAVMNEVTEFVSGGKTVFCKHVVRVDDSLRSGEDVVVINMKKDILAVGRAVIDGFSMKQFKRGQAVKVREGVR